MILGTEGSFAGWNGNGYEDLGTGFKTGMMVGGHGNVGNVGRRTSIWGRNQKEKKPGGFSISRLRKMPVKDLPSMAIWRPKKNQIYRTWIVILISGPGHDCTRIEQSIRSFNLESVSYSDHMDFARVRRSCDTGRSVYDISKIL